MTKKKSASKPRKVDFENEKGVLKEIAKALDIEPSDLTIARGSTPNGYGDAYCISGRGRYPREWYVMENDDEFEAAALEGVKRDLRDEPELFTQSWLEHYINKERLRGDLYSDVSNMNEETVRELSDRDFWKEYDRAGLDMPEENADGELPDPSEKTYQEDLAEAMTNEQLKDPMSYLEEIYGSDAAQKAIEIAGIDVNAASEAALREDGAAHFMCSYDDNYETSPSGFVYWRHN